jgi:ribosomal protein S21
MPVNVLVRRRKDESIDDLIKFFNEKCKKEKIFEKNYKHKTSESTNAKKRNQFKS